MKIPDKVLKAAFRAGSKARTDSESGVVAEREPATYEKDQQAGMKAAADVIVEWVLSKKRART